MSHPELDRIKRREARDNKPKWQKILSELMTIGFLLVILYCIVLFATSK